MGSEANAHFEAMCKPRNDTLSKVLWQLWFGGVEHGNSLYFAKDACGTCAACVSDASSTRASYSRVEALKPLAGECISL